MRRESFSCYQIYLNFLQGDLQMPFNGLGTYYLLKSLADILCFFIKDEKFALFIPTLSAARVIFPSLNNCILSIEDCKFKRQTAGIRGKSPFSSPAFEDYLFTKKLPGSCLTRRLSCKETIEAFTLPAFSWVCVIISSI